MPVAADAVAHLYQVLGFPPGAPIDQVREAQRKIRLEFQQTVWESRAERARAQSLVEAATYASEQLEFIRTTGERKTIPDSAAVERARAGCLVPLVLVAGLLGLPRILNLVGSQHETIDSPPTASAPVTDNTEPETLLNPFSDAATQAGEAASTSMVEPAQSTLQPEAAESQTPDMFTPTQESQPLVQSPPEIEQDPADVPSERPISDPALLPASPVVEHAQSTPQPEPAEPQTSDEFTPTQESQPPAQSLPEIEQDPADVSSERPISDPAPLPASDSSDVAEIGPDQDQIEEEQGQDVPSLDQGKKSVATSALTEGSFTLGSTEAEVRNVMGIPEMQSGDTWSYDGSSVTFRNGRVISYVNPLGSLKLR